MKYFIALLFCSLTTFFGLNTFAGEPFAFPADITHGNIRCVLMSVGQATVFPNKEDHNSERKSAWVDNTKGVPCFTVTYLVEELGDAPSAPVAVFGGSPEVLSAGKPIRFDGGEYHKNFNYEFFQSFLDFAKPNVSDPKRAIIMQSVYFGTISKLQSLSLIIEAGFGKDIQKFQFDSIQLQ